MAGCVGGMRRILLPILHAVLSSFRIRADLQFEVTVLRHQLEVVSSNFMRSRSSSDGQEKTGHESEDFRCQEA